MRKLRSRLVTIAALALTSSALGCLTVPLGPDRPELSAFATPPVANVAITVTPLRMGHTGSVRCAAAGQASCLESSEAVHVAYLVRHPNATFLIDSALSNRGKDDVQRFSFIGRQALDYTAESTLADELRRAGGPHVDFVILTHAHWDHTSGLVQLLRPKVIMGPGEAEFVRDFPKDAEPAVMPEHLANAEVTTFAWDGPAYENFPASHDLFGDGSVVLVPLPGHTPGSIGIFLSRVHGKRLLFVGDAAWSMDAIELPSHKLKPLSELTDVSPDKLSDCLWRLHHLHAHDPNLLIVPAHDAAQYEAVVQLAKQP